MELEIPDSGLMEDREEGRPDREMSPRDHMMARIAERAEANRQVELDQGEVYDREARANGMTADSPNQPGIPDEFGDSQEQPQYRGQREGQTVRVNVGGHEMDVNTAQLLELANLGMVARQTVNDFQVQQQQQWAAEQQFLAQQAAIDPNRIRHVVQSIQYRNEDEAAAALQDLILHTVRNVAPAQQQQVQQIDPRHQQRVQIAQMMAQEYPQVMQNPALQGLAHRAHQSREIAAQAAGGQIDYVQIAREAAEDALSAARQAGGAGARGDVLERKRASPTRVQQVLDRRYPGSAQSGQRPPTGSEVVDRMRKSRGQQSAMS
jgi:hypothetical protein